MLHLDSPPRQVLLEGSSLSSIVPLTPAIEARRLRHGLAKFGVRVSAAPGGRPSACAAGRAWVVAVGGAAAWAECYAAAFARPLAMLQTVDELWAWLSREPFTSVFIWLPERECTFAVVNRAMEVGVRRELPLGILAVPEHPEQATHLLTRLIGLKLSPRHFPHPSILYCDFVTEAPRGLAQCFGTSQVDQFLECSEEGAQALIFHGHGNGGDFRIGHSAICVQVDGNRPAADATRRVLPCQLGGRCRLEHKTNLRAFYGSSLMKASYVVLLSCWGFSPHDGLIEPAFTLSGALMRGDSVQALVTSTRINFTTPALAVAATRFVRAGATLGELALRINGFDPEAAPAYLCIGDPESRIAVLSEGGSTTEQASGAASSPRTSLPQVRKQALSPLRAAVGASFSADWLAALPESAGPVEILRELCAALLEKGGGGCASFSPSLLGMAMARAVSLLGSQQVHERWLPRAQAVEEACAGVCPLCSASTRRSRHESQVYRAYARVVRRCALHGVVEDSPEGFTFPGFIIEHAAGRVQVSLDDEAAGEVEVLAVVEDAQQRPWRGLTVDDAGGLLAGNAAARALTLIVARGSELAMARVPYPSEDA